MYPTLKEYVEICESVKEVIAEKKHTTRQLDFNHFCISKIRGMSDSSKNDALTIIHNDAVSKMIFDNPDMFGNYLKESYKNTLSMLLESEMESTEKAKELLHD